MRKYIIVLSLMLIVSPAFGRKVVFGIDLSTSFHPMRGMYLDQIMRVLSQTDGRDSFYIYNLDPDFCMYPLYTLFPPPTPDTICKRLSTFDCESFIRENREAYRESLNIFLRRINVERNKIDELLGRNNGNNISRIFEGIKGIFNSIPEADTYYFLTDGLEVNGTLQEGLFDFENRCDSNEIRRFIGYLSNQRNNLLPTISPNSTVIIYGICLPIVSPQSLPVVKNMGGNLQMEGARIVDIIRRLFENYFNILRVNLNRYRIGC
jgi:hypothetical protein